VIAEIDPGTGQAAARALSEAGRKAEFVHLDVTRPADVERAASEIQGRHGRIDILVANAGVAVNTPAEETSDEDWRRVVDLNLNGVFWCNRAFGRHMLQAGRGSIINIGSMSGIISNKPQPQAHYNATKAACTC
jgi:NAD(P)-dependent dehydrogenase (short-subunit alcohol dehydrogenase family)